MNNYLKFTSLIALTALAIEAVLAWNSFLGK